MRGGFLLTISLFVHQGIVAEDIFAGFRGLNDGNASFETEITAEESSLKLVQVLFLHGDRNPTMLIPSDTANSEESWAVDDYNVPRGLGELTSLGASQMSDLGEFLRRRYRSHISKRWNKKEIFVRSTDKTRTKMSAQALLSGLFPIERLIPIHTVPTAGDPMLYDERRCPVGEETRDRTFTELPRALKLEEEWTEFFAFLKNASGKEKVFLKNVWDIYDPLFVELQQGRQWPSWMNESLFDKLENITEESNRLYYHTEKLRRLRGGPLLFEILDRFQQSAKGEQPDLKLYLYSGHDMTLAALLSTLGIIPTTYPLYATAMMLELHEREGKHFIEIYHKNETRLQSIYRYDLEDCASPCQLDDLYNALSRYHTSDFEKECGIPEKVDRSVFIGVTATLSFTTLFFMTLAIVMLFLFIKYGLLWKCKLPTRETGRKKSLERK